MIPRYSRKEMSDIWTEKAKLQTWLEVEILAAEQLAEEGVVPREAVENIRKKADFNTERVLEIEKEVKHDVIAFLTNVAEYVGEDARFLHLGMTSSDMLDTAFSVQLVKASDLILSGLEKLMEASKDLAHRYKDTICIGRSHGIHAEPITFGVKVASWYAELARQRVRIQASREEIAVGAISGPVGTYAHLSPAVEKAVCERLGLKPDPVSTQVISRDRHAHLFANFAGLAGTLERIVVEVRHLQRTEVREAEENFTRGQKGSSAMPHKRNPILSENVTGLARLIRALAQSGFENVALWHERDISHSSVERVIAPDISIALDFAIHRVCSVVSGLQVYPENMKRNLELTHGLAFSGGLLVALAAKGLSREAAYKLVQDHAMKTWDEFNSGAPQVTNFADRIYSDQEIAKLLTKEELAEVFSLEKYTKNVGHIFTQVFG